jgi:hypothetical protein
MPDSIRHPRRVSRLASVVCDFGATADPVDKYHSGERARNDPRPAFLTVNHVARLVSGALTPLLALFVTQLFSIDTLATCVIAAAVVRLCLTPLLGPLVDN